MFAYVTTYRDAIENSCLHKMFNSAKVVVGQRVVYTLHSWGKLKFD